MDVEPKRLNELPRMCIITIGIRMTPMRLRMWAVFPVNSDIMSLREENLEIFGIR